MGRPKVTKWTQDAPKATFSRKVNNFDGFGDGRFLGHFRNDFSIQQQPKTPSSKCAKTILEKVLKLWPTCIQQHVRIHDKYGFRMCQSLKKLCKNVVKNIFLRDHEKSKKKTCQNQARQMYATMGSKY